MPLIQMYSIIETCYVWNIYGQIYHNSRLFKTSHKRPSTRPNGYFYWTTLSLSSSSAPEVVFNVPSTERRVLLAPVLPALVLRALVLLSLVFLAPVLPAPVLLVLVLLAPVLLVLVLLAPVLPARVLLLQIQVQCITSTSARNTLLEVEFPVLVAQSAMI